MKSFITLAVLCIALSADALPISAYQHSTVTVEAQSGEAAKLLTDIFSTVFSGVAKKIENGEVQSDDEIAKAFKSLLSSVLSVASKNVDPNNKVASTLRLLNVFKAVVPQIGGNSDSEERAETQSNEIAKSLLDGLSNIISTVGKTANPKNKAEQRVLELADTLIDFAKRKIGNGQRAEVEAEYMTSFRPLTDNAAMIEAFMNLSEEAKTQFWGELLGNVVSGVVSHAING